MRVEDDLARKVLGISLMLSILLRVLLTGAINGTTLA